MLFSISLSQLTLFYIVFNSPYSFPLKVLPLSSDSYLTQQKIPIEGVEITK